MDLESNRKRGLLSQIPPTPIGKSAWPWTEETDSNAYDSSMNWPKISIVTPSYNQADYIEETILSVIGQGYPNLEYIIVDGGSTDGSVEIIKKYENHLVWWISERDEGMYHAIQKGFEKSTGEIMGWINSDDILAPWSLFTAAQIFTDYVSVDWITGQNACIDEIGRNIGAYGSRKWSRINFLANDYKWIQQEGTFWRKSLWIKAGACMKLNYKLAGDLELWSRFFNYGYLYTNIAIMGYFRARKSNQKSYEMMDEYLQEAQKIISSMTISTEEKRIVDELNYEHPFARTPIIWRFFTKNIPYIQYPPYIVFQRSSQKFILEE